MQCLLGHDFGFLVYNFTVLVHPQQLQADKLTVNYLPSTKQQTHKVRNQLVKILEHLSTKERAILLRTRAILHLLGHRKHFGQMELLPTSLLVLHSNKVVKIISFPTGLCRSNVTMFPYSKSESTLVGTVSS